MKHVPRMLRLALLGLLLAGCSSNAELPFSAARWDESSHYASVVFGVDASVSYRSASWQFPGATAWYGTDGDERAYALYLEPPVLVEAILTLETSSGTTITHRGVFDFRDLPVEAAPPRDTGGGCCAVCVVGKPCGDSCIRRSYTCDRGSGCACSGSSASLQASCGGAPEGALVLVP